MQERTVSQRIFDSSCQLIPGGVNSPVRAFRELDMLPLIVEKGCGDQIQDVDGHTYIDYCMSWGSLMLGHAHPKIIDAVQKQVEQGSSFGIATRIEKDLASKIIDHLPSIEKIRFVSSGTEATMSAIRLARGYTGKQTIVKFNGNYHGHVDSLLIQAGSGVSHLPQASSKGIPKEMVQHTVSLPYNDVRSLREFFRSHADVAAVIIEPVAANMGLIPATREFLSVLREETQRTGSLLIFDEVVTGFRVGLTGAQGYYGIRPDLTCLGKIIGGGFPAAAFGGSQTVMDVLAPLGGVYQAGTLSGNPVAMRAGLEVLTALEEPGFYANLHQKMDRFLVPIEEWIRQKKSRVCVHRLGSMFTLFFGVAHVQKKEDLVSLDLVQFKQFFQFLFQKGIYLSPSQFETCFLSSVHTEEHLEKTQKAILDFLVRNCA